MILCWKVDVLCLCNKNKYYVVSVNFTTAVTWRSNYIFFLLDFQEYLHARAIQLFVTMDLVLIHREGSTVLVKMVIQELYVIKVCMICFYNAIVIFLHCYCSSLQAIFKFNLFSERFVPTNHITLAWICKAY